MKNVISPFLKDLITDWKNQKFSIIVDESTDISAYKHLCILEWYFSKKLQSVATRFLGIVPVPEATGEMILMPLKRKSRNVVKL